MPSSTTLFWVNKTPKSSHLSRSEDQERIEVFSQAQRASRSRKHPKRHRKQSALLLEERHRGRLETRDAAGQHYDKFETTAIPTEQRDVGKSVSLEPTIDPHAHWGPGERRSVAFFFDVTVLKIISLNHDFWFWKETVPRLTEHHAIFRHLVVAISSTHELLHHTDVQYLNTFALTQCNKATKSLRSSQDWHPTALLVSCILLSAFNLLRCDHQQADMTIESGLKLALSASNVPEDRLQDNTAQLQQILARLSKQHGYKLWQPDISYQFEKSQAASGALLIETDCVRGPFTDPDQALKAYRNIVSTIAKLLRNVARGAYVDTHCILAKETVRQLAMFSFYWQDLYNQVPSECDDRRTQLKEVRIAFNVACLLLYTKIISPIEEAFEAYPRICYNTLQLADEVLNTRHNKGSTAYLDISGSLFSMGLTCRSAVLRRRVVAMLQRQSSYEDRLVNWVRGKVVEMMISIQDQPLFVNCRHSGLMLASMSCKDTPRTIRVEYRVLLAGGTLHAAEFAVGDESCLNSNVTAGEIDECLQGIMAAYRMYGKPHASLAPRGYIREMYYEGRPVPVFWESHERS